MNPRFTGQGPFDAAEWEPYLIAGMLNGTGQTSRDLLARVPVQAFTGALERCAWVALIAADAADSNLIGVLTADGIPVETILGWAQLDREGAFTTTAEREVLRAYNEQKLRAAAADFAARRIGPEELAAATAAAASDATGENVIVLPGGDVSITAAAEKVFSLIGRAHGLFYRGGRVHEIAGNADGTRRLDPISPAQFRSRLECYGRVFTWRAGKVGGKF